MAHIDRAGRTLSQVSCCFLRALHAIPSRRRDQNATAAAAETPHHGAKRENSTNSVRSVAVAFESPSDAEERRARARKRSRQRAYLLFRDTANRRRVFQCASGAQKR